MKCAICNKKTNYDKSYGIDEFIVCSHCYERLSKYNSKNYPQVLDFIFECGYIRHENVKEIFK